MNSLVLKLLIWWMAATMAHVPFPVCDGDEFNSCPECFLGASTANLPELDLDFVLLGCEHPYDDEQGPWGQDAPDSDLGAGLFPVCLPARMAADFLSPPLGSHWTSWAYRDERVWRAWTHRKTELYERLHPKAAPRQNPATPAVLRC